MGIRVLLADDNALFRHGIGDILRADGRFDVVGHASRGDEAVAAASELRPDLILMDLQMPGMTGIEAIEQIRSSDPHVPIGVLSMFETQQWVNRALTVGANGYVAKDATPTVFCDAAHALAQGTTNLVAVSNSPSPARPVNTSSKLLARLTEREVQVLRLLATGAGTAEIARSLRISPKTLRNHISNTYHKLGIFDRAQAVIIAVREGLVDAG